MDPAEGTRSYQAIVDEMLDFLALGGRLTDTEPGSILRTLIEAYAREMVEGYAQLGHIYRSGFIDSAESSALDQLAALLDVKRADGAAAYGVAVFNRDRRVAGRITIPRGTQLQVITTGATAPLIYQTANSEELRPGHDQISASIFAPISDDPEAADPQLDATAVANAQFVLPEPIAGIAGFTINEPTAARGHNESDGDLRARLKGLVAAAGGGTAKALENAVLATGYAKAVRLRDAMSDGLPQLQPGELEVVVDLGEGHSLGDAAVYEAIEAAVLARKGPGVLVRLGGITSSRLRIACEIMPASESLDADAREALLARCDGALRELVGGLAIGDGLKWNKILSTILSIDGVDDLPLAKVTIERDGVPVDGIVADGNVVAFPDLTCDDLQRLILPDEQQAVLISINDQQPVFVQLELHGPAEPAADRQSRLAATVTTYLREANRQPTIVVDADALRAQLAVVLDTPPETLTCILHCYVSADQSTPIASSSEADPTFTLADGHFLRPSSDEPIFVWGTP